MSVLRREHIGDAPGIDRRALLGLLLFVGGPVVFLTALNVRYMLVRPACGHAIGRVLLELSTLIVLIGSAIIIGRGWQLMDRKLREVDDSAAQQTRFVATSALLMAALSLLAGIALWLPSLFLSPCGRP